jgi:hypothetical protein
LRSAAGWWRQSLRQAVGAAAVLFAWRWLNNKTRLRLAFTWPARQRTRLADINLFLREKGLKSFFDRRDLVPGLPWAQALEQAIGAATRALPIGTVAACGKRPGHFFDDLMMQTGQWRSH